MNIEYDVKEILTDIKQSFEKIDTRFDKLESKLDKVSEDVGELKTNLVRVELELKGDLSRIELELKSDLSRVEQTLQRSNANFVGTQTIRDFRSSDQRLTGVHKVKVVVFKLSQRSSDDLSAINNLIQTQQLDPTTIVAILGKTEGNGCVNDFRGFAIQSLKTYLSSHLIVVCEQTGKGSCA